jgi:hypothetical protein
MLIRGRAFPALICAAMLTGCGLSVPEMRDFPNNGTPVSNDLLVQAIIMSVHCELKGHVRSARKTARKWMRAKFPKPFAMAQAEFVQAPSLVLTRYPSAGLENARRAPFRIRS